MREPSTDSTTPARRATADTPESRANGASIPVPTKGFSARNNGTAWRCMFAPIKARFASSCSKNGIKPAPTEITCDGDTSIYSISAGAAIINSPS